MAATNKHTVETLLEQGEWEAARQLIQEEVAREPDNHWLITQLGVTHYEQQQYREALRPLLDSFKIVPDCPLTLWNLAGVLDALGKSAEAINLYAWLLRSKKSPTEDSCWESEEWTNALKTDCVYRLGSCFQHMEKPASAELCFRQYIDLLLGGAMGTYAIEDAAGHIRELHGNGKRKLGKGMRAAIDSILQKSGVESIQGGRRKLTKQLLAELRAS